MDDKTYILNDNIPVCDRDGIIQIEHEKKMITTFTAVLLAVSVGLMCMLIERLI